MKIESWPCVTEDCEGIKLSPPMINMSGLKSVDNSIYVRLEIPSGAGRVDLGRVITHDCIGIRIHIDKVEHHAAVII